MEDRDMLDGISFSDMFKDAYGFRPRNHRFYDDDCSESERKEIMDFVYQDVLEAIEADKRADARAIEQFEKLIDGMLALGAGTRETALRWLRQAHNCENECDDYFRFELGLPYNFKFSEKSA